MKKFLAGVLAGMAILSCTSITAFANEALRPPERFRDGILMDKDVFDENGNYASEVGRNQATFKGTIYTDQKIYLSVTNIRYYQPEYFEIKLKNGKNSDLIKSIKLVRVKVTPNTDAYDTAQDIEKITFRPLIEVTFNDIPSDEELKVELRFMAKYKETLYRLVSNGEEEYPDSPDDFIENLSEPLCVKGDSQLQKIDLYLQSRPDGQTGSSKEFTPGSKFYTKPEKNDQNEVVWSNANDDLVKVDYMADSDAKVYYPKMTTTWDNAVYRDYFANADAYKYEFAFSPKFSTTSRATLVFYNPFYEDYEYTVNAEDLYVYQLVGEEFVDVTKKFTAGVDDQERQILSTKTRELGYYVISDQKISA